MQAQFSKGAIETDGAHLLDLESYWNDRLTFPTGKFNPGWVRKTSEQDRHIPRGTPQGKKRSVKKPGVLVLNGTAFTALGPQPERMTGCSGCFNYTTTHILAAVGVRGFATTVQYTPRPVRKSAAGRRTTARARRRSAAVPPDPCNGRWASAATASTRASIPSAPARAFASGRGTTAAACRAASAIARRAARRGRARRAAGEATRSRSSYRSISSTRQRHRQQRRAAEPSHPRHRHRSDDGDRADRLRGGRRVRREHAVDARSLFRVDYTTTCATFTWTDKSGNLPDIPVDSVTVNPDIPAQVYAGTDIGLYFTNDITANPPVWQRFSAGVPSVMIWDMQVDRGATALSLWTRGRGAFAWPLPTP